MVVQSPTLKDTGKEFRGQYLRIQVKRAMVVKSPAHDRLDTGIEYRVPDPIPQSTITSYTGYP